MLKRFLLATILLLVSAPVLADPPTPLLWRADGEGTVYLLGSFHLLKPTDYPLAASVESAYEDASRVVFEIAPEVMESPDLARQMMQRGMLPPGQKLTELLQPETVELLVTFLGSRAALANVERFKPWFFSLGVAISAMQAAGFDPQHGLDQHFMKRALADGKATAGLEGIEEQLAALDGAPFAEQEAALREALKPLPELRTEIDRLHRAWREGDASAIESMLVGEMMALTPVSARLLNIERNQRWLPQVRELLDQPGTTLVVVGALHLVGDDGVPALLRAQGVEVERVGGVSSR